MLKEFKIFHFTKQDGTEYSGGMKNDVPSGFGIFKNNYGKEYRCEWEKGTIEGIANIIYVDGREFLGRYKAGQKYGVGKVTFGNKVYIGEFHQNQRTGSGELIEYESSDLLSSTREFSHFSFPSEMKAKYIKKGYYLNGRLSGFGINQVPFKNYSYIGMYVDGSSDGDGIEITKEGRYNGKFRRGLRQGPGEFLGEISFRGYWSKGLKDRFGIERASTGEEYEGAFEKGKKNGVGNFRSLDGVAYVGYFRKSMRSSFGKLEQNGSIYVGGFKENKKHGLGYDKENNQMSYFGEWQDDVKHGLGYEVRFEDEYKGEFFAGKRHGKGILRRRGQEKVHVLYKDGFLHGSTNENLSFLKLKFTKTELDDFFLSCKNKLDGILETLDEQRSQFEIDISFIKTDFKTEQKELKEKLLQNRVELNKLEMKYKALIENFDKNMRKQMGRTLQSSEPEDDELLSSSERSRDAWQPMSFTPGKYDHDYPKTKAYTKLRRDNILGMKGRSKDGETGRLMNSDYYTNMLKSSFNQKKSTTQIYYKNSSHSFKNNESSSTYFEKYHQVISQNTAMNESINKKLNFNQSQASINSELDFLAKSKLEVEMKARALESARRRHVEVKRKFEKMKNIDIDEFSNQMNSKDSLVPIPEKNFQISNPTPSLKKKKILTPHKIPPPESNRKSVLKGTPRSVFLDVGGFKDIAFFDDMMVIGGVNGILSFKENYGSFSILARNEEISVSNVKIFEERSWVVALENTSKNLLVLNMQLSVIQAIKINEEKELEQNSKSSLFIKDNLCIWNSNNNIFIVDLYTKRIKKIESLFEVKDLVSMNLAFLADPRKQTIFGYSKSLSSDNIYAIFAEDSMKNLKTTKIIHISDKFSICRDFRCMAECGNRFFLVGGSAVIEKNKSRRPFITLISMDETMVPISGKILDEPGSDTINCIKTLEDETGYTVCAGSKGFIFIFKVQNSVLDLQQKYKLDSSDFLADSIDYYASHLYLVSQEYPQIKIIQMNNYKPTRPHSLCFSKWELDEVYQNIQELNKKKLDSICRRMKPFSIQNSTLNRYQEIVSFNLGSHEKSAHLKGVIKNYHFKLMNKQFSKLSDYEIKNIVCFSEDEKSNFWTIKVLTGEKNLICLNDIIMKVKLDFSFVTHNQNTNILFVMEEDKDLAMLSLNGAKIFRVFDFGHEDPDFKLNYLSSTTNCLKVFGAFNNTKKSECVFRIYEKDLGFKTHHFPHLMDYCSGCETDFNQEYVFVIGKQRHFAVLTAFEFEKDMIFSCDFMRSRQEFTSLQRIPGTNVLVLSTIDSILFLRFFEESFVLEREVKFEKKQIEVVEMIKGDIWIKFFEENEITKFGLTPKDQIFNKEFLMQNETRPKLEEDMEFFGNLIEPNFTKHELLRLFRSYNLEKENSSIQEKVKIDIENLEKDKSDNDSDNQITAKGNYGSGIQSQNLSRLEKTMPKFGFDESKKTDSEVEDAISKTEKVLDALDKLESFEGKSENSSNHIDDFESPDVENFGLVPEKMKSDEETKQDEGEEDNYATFNKSEDEYNSKPHIPLIPDFINVSQHSSIKAKEGEETIGSNIETTKKNNDQIHSAASHLPTNKPVREEEPPIEWFKNFKLRELVNVESEEIVKIRVSKSGKYIYLLTNFEGLLIAEMDSSRLVTEQLTEEEIYNFFCLEGDICIAFAVQRSSVLVFKGKRTVNVLHSDDESLKNPFLTGISSYEPKFTFGNSSKTKALDFDKKIIEESNEESNHEEGAQESQRDKSQGGNKIKFLWMEGRSGVKYLEYDSKEMDCSSGELMTLWKNERDFNEFIILTVEELKRKELILGLAFQDKQDTFLQIYDLNIKQAQTIYFKDKEIFENKIVMSMISINKDESLVCAGSIKRSSEDEESDSLIMVLSLEKNENGKMDLKQENMAIFTIYSKFLNVKKVNEFDFIACAEWDLLILRYEDQTIYTCQVIEEMSEGVIFDAYVFGSSVYTVCDDLNAACKVIEFDEEIPVEA